MHKAYCVKHAFDKRTLITIITFMASGHRIFDHVTPALKELKWLPVASLAFGWADNSYLDIDNSAYHKNLIQYLIILDITLNVIQ